MVVSAADGARSAHGVGDAESCVYRTTDADRASDEDADTATVEWTLAMDGLPDPEGTVRAVLAAGTGPTLFALNNRGLYRSDDAGEQWARLAVEWSDEYESRTPGRLAVVRD
ncbi:MAG: hypothetical protein V5A28_09680 [Haloarculaceae archaeon]